MSKNVNPNRRELKVYGVPTSLKKTLINVAAHEGTNLTELIKKILRKGLDGYPPYMREPMLDEAA